MTKKDHHRLLEIRSYLSLFKGELAKMDTGSIKGNEHLSQASDLLSDALYNINAANTIINEPKPELIDNVS